MASLAPETAAQSISSLTALPCSGHPVPTQSSLSLPCSHCPTMPSVSPVFSPHRVLAVHTVSSLPHRVCSVLPVPECPHCPNCPHLSPVSCVPTAFSLPSVLIPHSLLIAPQCPQCPISLPTVSSLPPVSCYVLSKLSSVPTTPRCPCSPVSSLPCSASLSFGLSFPLELL